MTLALFCQFAAQHVSDVNTSIFRSLQLLGALLRSRKLLKMDVLTSETC